MRLLLLFTFLLTILTSTHASVLSNETIAELQRAYDFANSYAIKCDGGVALNGGAGQKECRDGDSTLWNGLSCASGEDWACDAVIRSQNQTTGRIWRSPRRVGLDTHDSLSRDMGEGVMSFLVKTMNVTFANKWTDYVDSVGQLCPDATDNRCWVVPSFWCNYGMIGEFVGYRRFKSDILDIAECPGEDFVLWYSASKGEPGYSLHLVAVNLFNRGMANQWNDFLQKAAHDLHKRQPINPFFEWLATGTTEALAQRFLTDLFTFEAPIGRAEWCWQRADSKETWKVNSGFDMMFMINLLLHYETGPSAPPMRKI